MFQSNPGVIFIEPTALHTHTACATPGGRQSSSSVLRLDPISHPSPHLSMTQLALFNKTYSILTRLPFLARTVKIAAYREAVDLSLIVACWFLVFIISYGWK